MIFKKDAKIKYDLDGNSYEDTITSPKEFDKIKNKERPRKPFPTGFKKNE